MEVAHGSLEYAERTTAFRTKTPKLSKNLSFIYFIKSLYVFTKTTMSMERDFVKISINRLRGSSCDLHIGLCGGILAQCEYVDLV